MNSYTIGSIVMIAALAVFTLAICIKLIVLRVKNRAEFKNYIKTYKYGKFLWVYILAIPLFAMSYHYSGIYGFDCFFKAFTSASKLMTLQFDVTLDLSKVNVVYANTVIACYCIATFNLLLFIASCLGQIIWNAIGLLQFKFFKNDKCLILGHGAKNEAIYNSIAKVSGSKVKRLMADYLDKSDKWELYTKNIHYHGSSDPEKLQKYIKGLLKNLLKKYNKKFKKVWKPNSNGSHKPFPKLQIIVNFQDQKTNANMCAYLSSLVKEYVDLNNQNCVEINKELEEFDLKHKGKVLSFEEQQARKKIENKKLTYLPFLDIYIYGDSEKKSLYSSYITDFSGCLHFVSDQEIIATDFIKKYPIAKLLTSEQIDYKTSLLKDDVKINITFVGFGRTQQELFKMIYSNTQFAKRKGNDLTGQCVEYHIYDQKATWNEKNFNDTFNRMFNFIDSHKSSKKDYYPFPEIIRPHFEPPVNVNSLGFIDASIKELEKHGNSNNVDVIFVSLESDAASIEYVNKLWNRISTKGKEIKNCHLFVKIDDKDTFENMSDLFEKRHTDYHSSCDAYGCLEDTALDYETVVMQDITMLAAMGDAIYNHSIYDVKLVEDKKTGQMVLDKGQDILRFNEQIVEQSRYKWERDSEYNRASSIASALNLRSKLLLMGLDYVKEKAKVKDAYGDFISYWEFLDPNYPAKLSEPMKIGKMNNGVDYLCIESPDVERNYFNVSSRRWALVFMEHNRWNAFNIAYGYVPYKKDDIVEDCVHNNKNLRLHACLTTMKGLVALADDLKGNCTTWSKQLVIVNKKIAKEKDQKKKLELEEKRENIKKAIKRYKNCDMIKLDYLQFDAAWQFLKKIGYKIVEKDVQPKQ